MYFLEEPNHISESKTCKLGFSFGNQIGIHTTNIVRHSQPIGLISETFWNVPQLSVPRLGGTREICTLVNKFLKRGLNNLTRCSLPRVDEHVWTAVHARAAPSLMSKSIRKGV